VFSLAGLQCTPPAGYDHTSLNFIARGGDSLEMAEHRNVRNDEEYCRVHGEASGPISDDAPCPLPHAAARCPVCSLGWIGPGPGDSVVLCILTRHIVDTHPNTAHATTLRFNAGQLGGSPDPDDWCHHDTEQHRRVLVLEPMS
jgi:hypothetical protein